MWSAADAKKARIEHAEAERELLAIEARYTHHSGGEDRMPLLSRMTQRPPELLVSCVIASPAALAALWWLSGYHPAAAVAAGLVSLSALLATTLTPCPKPIGADCGRQDGASKRRSKPLRPQVGNLEALSDIGLVSLSDSEEPITLMERRQEVFAGLVQLLLGGTAAMQLMLLYHHAVPIEWRKLALAAIAASTACATFQLACMFEWLLLRERDVCCLAPLAKAFERAAVRHRAWSQALRLAVGQELRAAKETLLPERWRPPRGVHRAAHLQALWRSGEADDGLPSDTIIFTSSSTEIAERRCQKMPTCCAAACTRILDCQHLLDSTAEQCAANMRTLADALGGILRQSPLKAVACAIELILAVAEWNVTPMAFVALASAAALALGMTDYVRSASNDVAYAEGLRNETELRQQSVARQMAEMALRRTLQLPLDAVEPFTLNQAIEDAERDDVPAALVARARLTLERVVIRKKRRRQERKEKREVDNAVRERSAVHLATVMALPPLGANLGELMVAIDDARAAGVMRQTVAEAEHALKTAAHMQGIRTRAEARLRAYVDSQQLPEESPSGERGSASSACADEEVGSASLSQRGSGTLLMSDDRLLEDGTLSGFTPLGSLAVGAQDESRGSQLDGSADRSKVLLLAFTRDPPGAASASSAVKTPTPSRGLLSIDLKELDDAIGEARTTGVDPALIEAATGVRKEVISAQLGRDTTAEIVYARLRRRSSLQRWRTAGGEARLTRALTAGKQALELLHTDREAGPLSAALEGLLLACDEAQAAGSDDEPVAEADRVIKELRHASDQLDRAHSEIEVAMDAAEDYMDYISLTRGERLLINATQQATRAYVDRDLLGSAESKLRELRRVLKAVNDATERLVKAEQFCNEQLKLFYTKKRSQLKVVAIPALTSSIELAKNTLVPPACIRDAELKLEEAIQARKRAEETTAWLGTASRAGVKALLRAAEDKKNGHTILQVSVDSLAAAIEGAKDSGVDDHDIASAEELLTTLTSSLRRASLRDAPTLPAAMIAKYAADFGDPRLEV